MPEAENARSKVRPLPDTPPGYAAHPPRRVVITGLGAMTPLGATVAELWQGMLKGHCGVHTLLDEEFAEQPVRIAATAPDPASRLPRSRARRMNRAAQFAVLAAQEAWQDAGFDPAGTVPSGLAPDRVGVSMGTIIGGTPVMVASDRTLRAKGPRGVSPLTNPMTVPSQAASQISLDLHITGEARTVTSACASGTEAIGQAIDRIRHGHLDVVLAGGAEAVITPVVMAAFAAMRALSTRNDDPASASRPFDRNRDGFVCGEGAGVLVLESEEHARARGARVYCEAAGWGLSADAHHIAAPDATGAGIALALRHALADAGAPAASVAHVNAHATATVEGDRAEALAMCEVLDGQTSYGPVPVTASKGHFGHMQGAAGGVEAIVTALTLSEALIPPTLGCDDPEEGLGLDIVTGAPRPLPPADVALSSSFGFGGHNAVLALRRCS
ncbi:beta-ketoacyl-[acyl-carrier-protein] synthase family protein [Streptomyces sp. NA04227]|uniref:beta-ketoacyl-[acyl-carrier-protein] synthase family protein n=1 Tax=Streptomyces sp. NA04227 TaxID=2742136 RepID=UPI00159148EF|nr:beta-ketoacyl-[acyl-carrier-protein] synthase family protein [Streptomyces sp. NA04227]QKW09789.1 beta-ketoacyl-[acyl-carrier-protein] synthase family protein [Streptomyces sp. NA04227]